MSDAAAANPYDLVPYESYSHRQTHIAHLHMLGTIHGLHPPDFRRARVLELGCGGGGNIIPMADQYRDSQFTGIDLSPVQIGQGRELAAALGLDNIDLRVESIMDVGASGDPFDYIICHGTFSWVPHEAREKILAIVRDRLSPDGLAVISYNALPGWAALRGLREMMMYHASFFATPDEKVTQARDLLQLITDGQGASQSFYRTMLEGEQAALRPKRDYYIFHEYLEPDNQAFYLHEFAAMAAQAGLAYLCDADPGVAFLGNYTDVVATKLAQIDDPIRREQYLDFIANRRFRSSLLTRRKDAARAPASERLGEFWLCGQLRPAGPEPSLPLAARPNLVFTGPGEVRFTAYDRATAAMFLTLWHVKRPLTLDALTAEAKARYRLEQPVAELRRFFQGAALRLFQARGLIFVSDPGRHVTEVSERPVGLPVARAQAPFNDRVTNGFHETGEIEPVCRALLPLLDGTRDRAALMDSVATLFERGQLILRHEGKPVTDAAVLRPRLKGIVDGVLAALAESALLIG